MIWIAILSLPLIFTGCFYTPPEEVFSSTPPLKALEFDVTKTQCAEIVETRNKVWELYMLRSEEIQETTETLFQQAQEDYEYCLKLQEQTNNNESAGNCEQEWENTQKAYELALQDLSNESAYQNYQQAKEGWDLCFNEKRTVQNNSCFDQYQKRRETTQRDHERLLLEAAQKRDRDLQYLDELEKKCGQQKDTVGSVGEDNSGTNTKKIPVISYNGKYLPVEQLKRFVGEECDQEEHWHARDDLGGIVPATDNTNNIDPGGCGFGKTKNTPVLEVEVVAE